MTLSGNLTTNGTPLPVASRSRFTLGTGGSPQTCSGTTDSNGNVSCAIECGQPAGRPDPVTATFGGNTYYASPP